MLAKTIKWEDPFTGEEREKVFYFHVGMGDLSRVDLQYGFQGGLEGVAKAVTEARDAEAIIALFEKLVAMSYGQRTADGDFVKTAEERDAFMGGRAYDKLFYELVTDAGAGSEFFNGIMPAEVKKRVREMRREKGEPDSDVIDLGTIQTDGTVKAPEFSPTAKVMANIQEPKEPNPPVEKPAQEVVDPFAKALSEYTYEELQQMPYEVLQKKILGSGGNAPRQALNVAFQRSTEQK